MSLVKTVSVAVGVMAALSLAACGGGSATSAESPSPSASAPPAASAPSPASAPAPASGPAVSTVKQSQAYTGFQYLDEDVVGKAATLTFEPNSPTGNLSIGPKPYATLTTDAANDGMLTIGGTPNYGITLGEVAVGAQLLLPGIIEACEAVSGDGSPNPAISNLPTKSTNLLIAGARVVDTTVVAGRTFSSYYEDCLRDGNPVTPATSSSLIIDGSGNETVFDSRTGKSSRIPVTSTLKQVSAAGLNGDWIVPYLYSDGAGQLRYALIEHGLVSAGNSRNFIGVWLEQ